MISENHNQFCLFIICFFLYIIKSLYIVSDSNSDENTPPKKVKRLRLSNVRRKQKFLKEWLKDPKFNLWLSPDSTDK